MADLGHLAASSHELLEALSSEELRVVADGLQPIHTLASSLGLLLPGFDGVGEVIEVLGEARCHPDSLLMLDYQSISIR